MLSNLQENNHYEKINGKLTCKILLYNENGFGVKKF